jgi:hypothetical protein
LEESQQPFWLFYLRNFWSKKMLLYSAKISY